MDANPLLYLVLVAPPWAVHFAVLAYVATKHWRKQDPSSFWPVAIGSILASCVVQWTWLSFVDMRSNEAIMLLLLGLVGAGALTAACAEDDGVGASLPTAGLTLCLGLIWALGVPRSSPLLALTPLVVLAGSVLCGAIRVRSARAAVGVLLGVSVFAVNFDIDNAQWRDEQQIVMQGLPAAIEQGALPLIFASPPSVEWTSVSPGPKPMFTVYALGKFDHQQGGVDVTWGEVGINLQLASPLTMKPLGQSLFEPDPKVLEASGLKSGALARLSKTNMSGPRESTRHVGGPADMFMINGVNGALGEFYVRDDRLRIELYGSAHIEGERVTWKPLQGP